MNFESIGIFLLLIGATVAIFAIRVGILALAIFFLWNAIPFNINSQISFQDAALISALLLIVSGFLFGGNTNA